MSSMRILVMMLPRFGVNVPMGNGGNRHWRDVVSTGPPKNLADWDPFTGKPY